MADLPKRRIDDLELGADKLLGIKIRNQRERSRTRVPKRRNQLTAWKRPDHVRSTATARREKINAQRRDAYYRDYTRRQTFPLGQPRHRRALGAHSCRVGPSGSARAAL